MEVIKKNIKEYPLGVWIAIIALILICLAWFMQIYSLIDWEGAVKLGLQGESFNGDAAERAIADVERSVAYADILWGFPITIIAFIGVWLKKFFGFIAAMMAFAISVYFPLLYTFRENMSLEIIITANLMWGIPSLFGIYCLWINRNFFIDN
jgi:hypothetical protein